MTSAATKPIYLDYNATTPIDPAVLSAMLPYLRDEFGNPSLAHPLGRRARDAIEGARIEVANLIGAATRTAKNRLRFLWRWVFRGTKRSDRSGSRLAVAPPMRRLKSQHRGWRKPGGPAQGPQCRPRLQIAMNATPISHEFSK